MCLALDKLLPHWHNDRNSLDPQNPYKKVTGSDTPNSGVVETVKSPKLTCDVVCVCGRVCLCAYGNILQYTLLRIKGQFQGLVLTFLLTSGRNSLAIHLFLFQANQSVSFWVTSRTASVTTRVPGLQITCFHIWLYLCVGNRNSGLYACVEIPIPNETLPQPKSRFLKKKKKINPAWRCLTVIETLTRIMSSRSIWAT